MLGVRSATGSYKLNRWRFILRLLMWALFLWAASLFPPTQKAEARCHTVEITPNTPTGIAGCYVWGEGIASHYGPGNGVAMNFCTWVLRHEVGCGWVNITALDSNRSARVPVVDFCDCYTGTNRQRIVDLEYGVLDLLGLDPAQGLYKVRVEQQGPIYDSINVP